MVCMLIHDQQQVFSDMSIELGWHPNGQAALVRISKVDSHCYGQLVLLAPDMSILMVRDGECSSSPDTL